MTLKDIVPHNEDLYIKGMRLLNETNFDSFKLDYFNVVEEILIYRNKHIDDYILDFVNQNASKVELLPSNMTITIFSVSKDDVDQLGILVEQLMNRFVSWKK